MKQKFGRNYSLSIGTSRGGTLLVNLPFTIEFDITRNILSSVNTSSIRIYNLSEDHRNQIRFNFYNSGEYRPITLSAGYGQSNLSIIFKGNITQASSVREGNNFITTIECFDGGFAFVNAQIDPLAAHFTAGTSQTAILTSLINSLSQFNVSPGAVGDYPNTILKGEVYDGSTAAKLREITQGGFFIDNEKAYCLGPSECAPSGGLAVINSQSGLLATPVLEQTILTFDMLFEPSIISGQLIQLESITDSSYNGPYKVVSLKHRGMISPAVCGDAVTSLGMFYGLNGLTTASELGL